MTVHGTPLSLLRNAYRFAVRRTNSKQKHHLLGKKKHIKKPILYPEAYQAAIERNRQLRQSAPTPIVDERGFRNGHRPGLKKKVTLPQINVPVCID